MLSTIGLTFATILEGGRRFECCRCWCTMSGEDGLKGCEKDGLSCVPSATTRKEDAFRTLEEHSLLGLEDGHDLMV